MKQYVKISLFSLISIFALHNTSYALQELRTRAAFETAINKNEYTVIDFFMPSCIPCKKIAPLLDALSKELSSIAFFKVDITKDDLELIARKYNVRTVPCLIFLKNGNEVGRHKGAAITKSELADKISLTFDL